MWKMLEDVSEREYCTMMERLRTLETEQMVENLYDLIDMETETLMEKLGVTNGDIVPDQITEFDEAIRKIAEIIVDVAYQNIGESLG